MIAIREWKNLTTDERGLWRIARNAKLPKIVEIGNLNTDKHGSH
jgi:hypothetical protein